MAIIQISKIKQRSGDLVDLPQLDEAQLGWANDAKRLFIGASNVAVTNVENVEVLTSYSTISFSQVEGSGGSNVNITTPIRPGQILAYDISTNSWINTGGNANSPANTAQYTGIPIHLGTVANVKIGGGATGYILETDGQGNLNWTSKGTLRTEIIGVSNTTPVIITVANTTPYSNGLKITISGANTSNSNIVNGKTFYVKLDANFSASNTTVGSGNVTLFTSADLAPANAVVGTGLNTPNNYIVNSGVATALLGSAGAANAGGSVNSIQYNDSGILNGSANFTIIGGNTVSLTGGFSATTIAGSLTTASQTNITSVGTLISLSSTGNITGANITGSHYGAATGLTGIPGANVTGIVANATYATTAGGVAGVNVSGQVANALIADTALSVAGVNVSGQVANALIADTAITVAVGNVSGIGNIAIINLDGNGSNILYGNGIFASAPTPGVSYGNSNVATFLASYGSNTISTTGTITAGTIISTVLTTGSNTVAGTITGNFSLSAGSRLNATYADLAEYYEADTNYEPGTVLAFGGNKEVTIAEDGTSRVAGVVSTNPAYAMNANCQGIAVAIALQGRVPTKVRGIIRKGDMMISAGNGYARPCTTPLMGTVIGKALENFDGVEGIIEIAIGRL